ncbi:hypothetical protein [Metamycoplasma neophronis]|uniref:Transcriptional regulator n=1 Tax=Metamycoplasma neophronis TaxID=872983 RepID=A0ABY2Z017_9BACT|nr:hypothetical protein [Metamycoplasma neophronis]TPR54090.1 hypothetical protein FJR74_01455 [Metamycoplasma neophronis]
MIRMHQIYGATVKYHEYLQQTKNAEEIDINELKCLVNKEKLMFLKSIYKEIYTNLFNLFERSLTEEYREIYVAIFKTDKGFNIDPSQFFVSKSTFYRKVKLLLKAFQWLIC